jgi:hypothetical protein
MFSPGIFGPNFDIVAVGTAVPEPGSLVLLGVGLLGLAGAQLFCRRKVRMPRSGGFSTDRRQGALRLLVEAPNRDIFSMNSLAPQNFVQYGVTG